MRTDERYAEAERIAARMGFHPAFARVAAAQGEAAELAGARTRRAAAALTPARRSWWAARLAWTLGARRRTVRSSSAPARR